MWYMCEDQQWVREGYQEPEAPNNGNEERAHGNGGVSIIVVRMHGSMY